MSQPTRKGSVFEHLIWTPKHVGSTKESACTSATVKWILGSNGEFAVNSPALRKPKKPRQHAAQSMTWSQEFRSKERWMTFKRSIVMGRCFEVDEPCTCFMPRSSRCSCRQLIRGSGKPLSMWMDRTALRYTLMDEWWRLSAGKRAQSGLRWPSWWQKSK